MDLNDRGLARKIACPCRHCGAEFFRGKRNGRRREFCSNACRQAYFRNAEFGRRYQVLDPLRNGENSPVIPKTSKARKRGRAIPLNVLGGHRWPGAEPLDRELWRKIVRAEVGPC